MDIRIETIDADQQRYLTSGDWFQDGDVLRILVSESGNADWDWLVAVHELIEQKFCEKAGITAEQVDAWDMNFKGDGEPGNHKAAPYHAEHKFATHIEKLLAAELGIDWDEYDQAVARQESKT